MMENVMNGMFGKINPGMCKISVNGDIAIKTSNGYKTYDVENGRLVNCDNFVFGGGQMENFFFVIPTNHLVKGDIILAGGKPRAVLEVKDNAIETFCYEDSTISTIVPEHHLFLGKTYFYGKIVSLFGNAKGKGAKNIMKMMMMSQMFGGNTNSYSNNMFDNNSMMMLMMMNGNMGDMFDGMFDFDETDDEVKED